MRKHTDLAEDLVIALAAVSLAGTGVIVRLKGGASAQPVALGDRVFSLAPDELARIKELSAAGVGAIYLMPDNGRDRPGKGQDA